MYQLPLWLPDSLNARLRLRLASLFGCRLLLPMWQLSFPSEQQMKVLVDTEGWHRRVIGLRAGNPGATVPHGRLPRVGNWLRLLPLLLLLACLLLTDECLSQSFFFFFHSRCLFFAHLNDGEICGIKIWNGAAARLLTLCLGVWESWCNVGNKAGEDEYFHSQPLTFDVKALSGNEKVSFGILLNLLKYCSNVSGSLPSRWPDSCLCWVYCEVSDRGQELYLLEQLCCFLTGCCFVLMLWDVKAAAVVMINEFESMSDLLKQKIQGFLVDLPGPIVSN